MIAQQRQSTPNLTPLLFLMALIALAVFALNVAQAAPAVSFAQSHGVQKHGTSALHVRECLNKNGALEVWTNPENGRKARVCELSPGKFGIQIIEERDGIWQEITSFCKEKLNHIDQVGRYLRNSGYRLFE